MTICILGRQPEIGLAELEALYGSENVRPAGENCAFIDADVDFSRLGSSVKAAKHLSTTNDSSRKAVFKTVAHLVPKLLKTLPPEGKVKLGISVYGFDISPYELSGEALRLKKSIKLAGRSVRVVPNETPALSSAQTFHNRLADELGVEFVIVRDGNSVHIGRVTDVQDIDSYRIRDRERPKRDAFVGMLPPKLAQTIVNLAVGQINSSTFSVLSSMQKSQEKTSQNLEPRTQNLTVLDPFCGTGVILQEALLMKYDAYGTDVSKKMIDYSGKNLEWLKKTRNSEAKGAVRLEVADATDHIWRQPISVIATESYLGQPLGGQAPTKEKFAEIAHGTNKIIKEFFENIAPQLTPSTRLCVAVPVWFHDGTVTHLPVIDELESLGFTQQSFNAPGPLMYHRDDQVTGRELLVLVKQ